jgi:tRNA A-37 threonylcarbamoyl transferase component Bud32
LSAAHATAIEPPPHRVGRYSICLEIASGGMATVYLAVPEDAPSIDRAIALKRVHPHLATQRSFVEMFLDEARIASRIDHPNVCRVLDYGRADGSYFLTMEYLAGRSVSRVGRALAHHPREPELRPLLAARIVRDAALGLHAAHELTDEAGVLLDVVHRDVSPHNLFVAWDGRTSVVDFGIASARDRLHHTDTGMVKGKFAYMAPEQMLGAKVDRRADVWSLGVVLWELISGRALFRRRTEGETVVAVTQGDREELVAHEELCRIVDRALEREPGDRYSTAAELAAELEAWIGDRAGDAEVAAWMNELFAGEAIQERRVIERALGEHRDSGRTAIVRRTPRRRRWWMLPIAALVIAGVLAPIVYFTWPEDPAPIVRRPPTEVPLPPPAPPPIAPATAAIVPAPVIEPEPPPPAPIERPVGNGTVAIVTIGGWADVYDGRRRLGPTPGRFTLSAGRHVLIVRPHGGVDVRRVPVIIRRDQTTRVRVEL